MSVSVINLLAWWIGGIRGYHLGFVRQRCILRCIYGAKI